MIIKPQLCTYNSSPLRDQDRNREAWLCSWQNKCKCADACRHSDLAYTREFIQYGFVKARNYMTRNGHKETPRRFKFSLDTSKTLEATFIT